MTSIDGGFVRAARPKPETWPDRRARWARYANFYAGWARGEGQAEAADAAERARCAELSAFYASASRKG